MLLTCWEKFKEWEGLKFWKWQQGGSWWVTLTAFFERRSFIFLWIWLFLFLFSYFTFQCRKWLLVWIFFASSVKIKRISMVKKFVKMKGLMLNFKIKKVQKFSNSTISNRPSYFQIDLQAVTFTFQSRIN